MLEVRTVACCHNKIVRKGCGGNEAVFDRHRTAGHAQAGQKFGPPQSGLCVPWQASKAPHAFVEPGLQSVALFSSRQQEDSESKFAKNDGIDHKIPLVAPQPVNHQRIGGGSRWFAENVCVDQIFHSESVDSESTGT